jgi:hypothetical protein
VHPSGIQRSEPSFLHSCVVLLLDRQARQAAKLVAAGFAAGLEDLGINRSASGMFNVHMEGDDLYYDQGRIQTKDCHLILRMVSSSQ